MKKILALSLAALFLVASGAASFHEDADEQDLDNMTGTEPLYDTEDPDGFADLLFGYANTASGNLWAHGIMLIMFAVPMGSFLAKGYDTRTSFLTASFTVWVVGVLMWAMSYIGDYALSFVTIMMLMAIGLAYGGANKV